MSKAVISVRSLSVIPILLPCRCELEQITTFAESRFRQGYCGVLALEQAICRGAGIGGGMDGVTIVGAVKTGEVERRNCLFVH